METKDVYHGGKACGHINGMNLGLEFNTATKEIHPLLVFDGVNTSIEVLGEGGQPHVLIF